MIHPVVMAGGKGERFWPYSNSKHPKQILPLVTKQSMLEDTLRNIGAFHRDNTPVRLIVSQNLEAPVKKKLRGFPGKLVIAEPQGRNTAAAVALAARLIQREDPHGVMVMLTADHAIGPAQAFARAVRTAVDVARRGNSLVTFGIPPNRPETGYGYIEVGSGAETVRGLPVRKVIRFHEKPSEEFARAYAKSGDFLWNSGMFAWQVDYLWEQFRKHLPKTAAAFEAEGDLVPRHPTFAAKLKRIYRKLEDISIDYAILEKAECIEAVVPAFDWDDIGSWSSLDRRHAPDKNGNRAIGQTLMLDCEDTTCFSDEGLICAFGARNLLVVRHNGVTMVVEKSRTGQLKQLVKKVQENPRWKEYL